MTQRAERFTLRLEVCIRPARQDDLPQLEWFGQYRHYRDVFRRTFQEQQDGSRLMLVADVDGFPVGQVFINFANGRQEAARGYLYALRVLEPFRGRGIGTRLIREAERLLREQGCRWATIAASKENTAARRLYERLGYEVYAEDPGQWTYTDDQGRVQQVDEPAWMFGKRL